MAQSDPLAALREALALSPDNVPLRQHLAEMLLARGELAEAETAFRQAIALAPHSAELKIGLATTFLQQGKDSAALAIVETLVKERDPAPAAFVLYARLLWRAGQIADAVAQYAEVCGATPREVASQVLGFVRENLARGLLVRS